MHQKGKKRYRIERNWNRIIIHPPEVAKMDRNAYVRLYVCMDEKQHKYNNTRDNNIDDDDPNKWMKEDSRVNVSTAARKTYFRIWAEDNRKYDAKFASPNDWQIYSQ